LDDGMPEVFFRIECRNEVGEGEERHDYGSV
jgi:hypothetical protein